MAFWRVWWQGLLLGWSLNSVSNKTRVCKKKTSSLRLAKRQKAQFTDVNEHFCRKRNEKIGVFLQTLNSSVKLRIVIVND